MPAKTFGNMAREADVVALGMGVAAEDVHETA